MTTLRRALGQTEPHVSLKAAWKRVIQVSRRLRKEGLATRLHERAAIERLLALECLPEMDLPALKKSLQGVVRASNTETENECAQAIETWVERWFIENVDREVEILIHQPSGLISGDQIDRWLGTEDGRINLDAETAAVWVHQLDGMGLGGHPLAVVPVLGPNESLPAVNRDRRGRERSYETQAWLPHLDTEGHFSATPRCIAERHGELLAAPRLAVIDPFCGAGADAIAAAKAGATVLASDHNSGRVDLARQNAHHFGIEKERLNFRCGDAIELIREGLQFHPGATLFLDPPWGGVGWNREAMDFTTLFGTWPELSQLCQLAGRVVLKLPRTFDLRTLDSFGRVWAVELGLGPIADDHADRPRCLTAISDTMLGD